MRNSIDQNIKNQEQEQCKRDKCRKHHKKHQNHGSRMSQIAFYRICKIFPVDINRFFRLITHVHPSS